MDFDDPSLDYEKMAIHIKVKFRDSEPMQLLTPLRQSGGERALTTMLYLIAIQVLVIHFVMPCWIPCCVHTRSA